MNSPFSPGDLVVCRAHPCNGYLFRVVELHPAVKETFNKPTVTVQNVRPLIPIRDRDEEAYDKRTRRGQRYTYLADTMQPYEQPAQMRLPL